VLQLGEGDRDQWKCHDCGFLGKTTSEMKFVLCLP
jgi:hypothetical protein